jgi:hypothetical protein
MATTVILPTYGGNLSRDKRLSIIDDVRYKILPDADEAEEEKRAIVCSAPQNMQAFDEADYLSHVMTLLLLTLVQEEDTVLS